MNRSINGLVFSAAAIVLFGATASLQAQNEERANVPMAFHIGSTEYVDGPYELKVPVNPASAMTIVAENTGRATFALTGATMEHNDKTRARGPVLILKCASKGCYVTEIWTEEQGFAINHPRSLDEQVASAAHVVALTRVVKH